MQVDFLGLRQFGLYGFYDYGITWSRVYEGEHINRKLVRSSHGYGFRSKWDVGLGANTLPVAVNFEWAAPLTGERVSDGGRIYGEPAAFLDCCGDTGRWYMNLITQF